MDSAAVSQLVDTLKNLISGWLPSGLSVIGVLIVLAFLTILWDTYKDVVGDHLKRFFGPNLVLITVVGAIALFLVFEERPWTLGALAICTGLYLLLRGGLPSWKSKSKLSAATGIVVLLGSAYFYDVNAEARRNALYDVMFLLPPEGATEPEKLFVLLHPTLNSMFKDVQRVKVVPEKLSSQDVPEYAITRTEKLLAYKVDGLRPKVFIETRVNGYSAATPQMEFRMLFTPWHKQGDAKSIGPMPDWRMEALASTAAAMRGAAMRANFELIVYLSARNVLQLPAEARQKTWRNLLREYERFIELAAPTCPVRAKVQDRLTRSAGVTDDEIRGLLNEPCAELESRKDAEARLQRDVQAFRMRIEDIAE